MRQGVYRLTLFIASCSRISTLAAAWRRAHSASLLASPQQSIFRNVILQVPRLVHMCSLGSYLGRCAVFWSLNILQNGVAFQLLSLEALHKNGAQSNEQHPIVTHMNWVGLSNGWYIEYVAQPQVDRVNIFTERLTNCACYECPAFCWGHPNTCGIPFGQTRIRKNNILLANYSLIEKPFLQSTLRRFLKIGVPQNDWFPFGLPSSSNKKRNQPF